MIYLDLWIEKWQYTICAEQFKTRQKKKSDFSTTMHMMMGVKQ
jgi:hypothetical protein